MSPSIFKSRITRCPACGNAIKSVNLWPQHAMKPYRVCADCGAKYTADPCSRKRQLPLLILVLIVLGLNAAVPLIGKEWLVLAFVSDIVLLCYLAYAVSKVTWVVYQEKP